MRVVVAPDSFKGSLTSPQAAEAMAEGLRDAGISDVTRVPVADGGEGLTGALVRATGGTEHMADAHDALGRPLFAQWGMLGDGKTAVVEMAACAGLPLIDPKQRDIMRADTFGVGEMILSALNSGARRVILGLGGSATNDGGAGMARALGYRLLDAEGAQTRPGGGALGDIRRIDAQNVHPLVRRAEFIAACDVVNPLCGERGASMVFGPQKGATPEQARALDRNLFSFGRVLRDFLGADVLDMPGAGAAGGMGAGAAAFLGARLTPGFSIVARETGLAEKIARADLVLTGEGRTDGQTALGKAPMGVAKLAREADVPAVLISGALGEGYEEMYDCGVTACLSVSDGAISLEDAMRRAAPLLRQCARAVGRMALALTRARG